MSKYHCCVSGCRNGDLLVPPDITFHPFPTSGGLYVQWIEKIGPNVQVTRTTLVCSAHFKEEDFESSSGRRVLASSAVPSIFAWKAKINEEDKKKSKIRKTVCSNVENLENSTTFDLLNLPVDALEHIISFLSTNDVVSLSSVCVDLMRKVQALVKKWDFRYNYGLDVECLLNHALSTTCTSINVNYCYWLKPSNILEMISKTKLEHFHVIECQLDDECVRTIGELELLSLSFTYTKAWQIYLVLRLNETVRCFQTIRSLEIFYRPHVFKPIFYYELARTLFSHCTELEHLTISHSKLPNYDLQAAVAVWKSEFPTISPPPLPKLKSLVISNVDNLEKLVVKGFVKFVFPNEIIPYERFDFGYYDDRTLKSDIVNYPHVLLDKSTFCFWYDRDYLLNDEWLKNEDVEKVIYQAIYEKLFLKGFRDEGFLEMVQKLVSNSSQTVKEIRLDFTSIDHIMDSLIQLAINCPHITSVDASKLNLQRTLNCGNFSAKQNEVFDALAGLKNLEKLSINVLLLVDVYQRDIPESRPAFWKVTTACKQLAEIRIVNKKIVFLGAGAYSPVINPYTLSDIAHCKNLKSLYLDNVNIGGRSFDLSRITLKCAKLEHLFLHVAIDLADKSLEESLHYAKNIKSLSLALRHQSIVVNKTFIYNLLGSKNLEKIYLNKVSLQEEDVPYFSSSLLKFKKLVAVIVDDGMEMSVVDHLKRQLDRIASEKPAFFYSLQKNNKHSNVPEAHLDLIC